MGLLLRLLSMLLCMLRMLGLLLDGWEEGYAILGGDPALELLCSLQNEAYNTQP